MSTTDQPRFSRLELLGLLGSSAALGVARWSPALGADVPYAAGDGSMALEFDAKMACRVLQVDSGRSRPLRLEPGADGADYCCYSGASYEDRSDWIQRAQPGFAQRNFLGMNASDYGGGTPVVDVWRRDGGIAVGHVEPRPRLVALPIDVAADGARIAVESASPVRLPAGQSLTTPRLFVATHHGDHYATLVRYRKVMLAQGLHAPVPDPACYEPIWCARRSNRSSGVSIKLTPPPGPSWMLS